jgi:coproporphyrinogen III oxidase
MKEIFTAYIRDLQDRICAGVASMDGGAHFQEDLWERPEGGGGRTRVIENGAVLKREVLIHQPCTAHSPRACKPILGWENHNFLPVAFL